MYLKFLHIVALSIVLFFFSFYLFIYIFGHPEACGIPGLSDPSHSHDLSHRCGSLTHCSRPRTEPVSQSQGTTNPIAPQWEFPIVHSFLLVFGGFFGFLVLFCFVFLSFIFSVLHSFLLLNSIAMFGHITVYLSIQPLKDIWVVFSL